MVFKQRKTERQRDEFQAKRSGNTTTQCWPRAKTLPWWSSRRRWAMPTNEVLEPAIMEPTQGHDWDPRNSPCVAINPCWALGGVIRVIETNSCGETLPIITRWGGSCFRQPFAYGYRMAIDTKPEGPNRKGRQCDKTNQHNQPIFKQPELRIIMLLFTWK